jgi:hypothetical protein
MRVLSRAWKMLRSLYIKDKIRNATVDNERQFVRNAKKCFQHYVSLLSFFWPNRLFRIVISGLTVRLKKILKC